MLKTSQLKSDKDQTKAAYKVTLVGGFINALNGVLKILFGLWGGSQALVADGIHSFSDLVSDLFVLVSTYFGRQQADENHPYGHGKFETLGTLVVGFLLIAVAGALVWDGLMRLLSYEVSHELKLGVLLAVFFSIASKEWVYRYTLKVGERINSNILKANAWHHRTDSLSSIVVLFAVIGSIIGYPWLDQVATAIVGVMIAKVGGELIWDSLKELVDTALPEKDVKKIRQKAEEVPGVVNIHDLKTRTMGPQTLLDLHIEVNADVSVSEGHEIGVCVSQKIKETFSDIEVVNFHIDPSMSPGQRKVGGLPLRPEALKFLRRAWEKSEEYVEPRHIILHYLDGEVSVEVFYTFDQVSPSEVERLKEKLTKETEHLEWRGELRVWTGP